MPTVILIGARQVGKTTLARVGYPDRPYFTLDHLDVLGQAQTEPQTLLAARPLTLDEVQRAPEFLRTVKQVVDQDRRPGDFLLTGSANLLLMEKVRETLAGRAVQFELLPFCPVEWQQSQDQLSPIDRLFEPDFDFREWPTVPDDWQGWLIKGGYPSALEASDDAARHFWFLGYVQTYLERDLRQLSAISNLPEFQRLMAIAANRTARLVNQSDLARDAGLPQPTCHRYLNLLEAGCLITRLSPYSRNPNSGHLKAKKLFWKDAGLAAWLAGIRNRTAFEDRLDKGFWLEQTLHQTLQTWRSLDTANRRIFFWRDRSGREVDIVLEREGALVALELKLGQQVASSDADGIRAFISSLGPRNALKRGVVLNGGVSRPIGDKLVALPWGWMVPAAQMT